MSDSNVAKDVTLLARLAMMLKWSDGAMLKHRRTPGSGKGAHKSRLGTRRVGATSAVVPEPPICPVCLLPVRRRMNHGLKTDRYYCKSCNAVVCSACVERRVCRPCLAGR